MSEAISFEIDEDLFRANLVKYTRKAFQMLPKLEKPRILDIGCGSGIPTIELAKLSDGEILGIDIDQSCLDVLDKRIKAEAFSNRVRTMKCSIFEMTFPDKSFDIIWAEGSIHTIGFETGLKEWQRLIKTRGFLVVHDESKNMAIKLEKIPICGYDLLNYFLLPEDTWWREYYGPLEIRIKKVYEKYGNDPRAIKMVEKQQKIVEMVKKNPSDYKSVFFVMQKKK
ncbi:MAG: class I SAM-dependent methyltransferase [Candidatus Odinarchaeota archaeon]